MADEQCSQGRPQAGEELPDIPQVAAGRVLESLDEDAVYDHVVEIDASQLEPQIACPHTVDNVKPIEGIKGKKINQIVVGSCTNGRLDDIEIVAKTLKGKHVADGTRMLVFPASWRIYTDALEAGYLRDLISAGAVVCNPGCGPCLGIHQGALGDDEVALATTNRNFKGRMGNPGAEVFLCSPAVAAGRATRRPPPTDRDTAEGRSRSPPDRPSVRASPPPSEGRIASRCARCPGRPPR